MRKYGSAPYGIAVIHGGPGAPGEVAPVARELAFDRGVLEPLQTADTLEGQVEELKGVLEKNADLPVALIGYSWGAWLGLLVAARKPTLVERLIMISSGPFEERYARDIMKTRLSRLTQPEQIEMSALMERLGDITNEDKDIIMARVGELMSKADSYDAVQHEDEVSGVNYRIFENVWNTAEKLRSSGKLLQLAGLIQCPVTAVHGDYDPHPAEGVKRPLSHILKNFRFILLKKCGHKPWIEGQARDEFFRILKQELRR